MDEFNTNRFSELKNAILQTAAYADVFDYPLTSAEIHRYLTGVRTSREAVEQVLEEGSVLQARDGLLHASKREPDSPRSADGARRSRSRCGLKQSVMDA